MRIRTAAILCCSALGAAADASPASATPPVVTSIERAGPEHNRATYQQWTIHFDQAVYGVSASTNIQVERYPNGYGQAADVNFADGNSFAGVGVGTPSGTGTLAVHLINVGTIENAAHEHMVGGDDGEEMSYFVDRDGPVSTIFGDPLTGGVTSASPVRFLLDIDETPIAKLTGASVQLGGTAGATTATIVPDGGGDPRDRVIEVSGMTGPGSVTVDLPPGAFTDELDNPSVAAAFTAGANSAQYTGAGTPAPGGGGALPIDQLPGAPVLPTPTPSPSPSPSPPPAPAAPKLTLGTPTLKLSSKGRLSIPVTCAAATPTCTAAVTVSAGTGKRRHTLCKATAKIASGRRVPVAVTCGPAARKAIGKAGKKGLAVSVAVTATDGAGRAATAALSGKARRA